MNSIERRRKQKRRQGSGSSTLSANHEARKSSTSKVKRRSTGRKTPPASSEVILQLNGITATNDENVKNGMKQKHSAKKKRKQDLKTFKAVEFKKLPINSLGTVFWAKTSGSPWWPARYCIPEEVAAFPQLEASKNSAYAVFFFGSHDVGTVKAGSIIPYRENYDVLIKRNKTTKFKLGVEEAEEMILKAKPPSNRCMLCERDDGTITALICDRCNEEVHMSCLDPPLTKVPEGDWFCPRCKKEAPLTVQFSEELWRKKGISARQPVPSPTHSQEMKMVMDKKRPREAELPQTSRTPTPTPKKIARTTEVEHVGLDDADSICFLCKFGGSLVVCDFKGCPRSYHCACLGISEPPEGTKWQCPWHYCAMCSKEEDEKTSTLHKRPWPNIQHLRRSTVSLDGRCLEGAVKDLPPLARCMTCSFALCSEHTTAPRVVTTPDGKSVEPVAVMRGVSKTGFFKCCYCSGTVHTKDGTQKFNTPPLVVLADILFRLWSNVVNHHFRLAQPFLNTPALNGKASAVKSLVKSSPPASLSAIREKIITFNYTSFEQMKQDFDNVGRVVSTVVGSKDSMLEDLAYTIGVLITSAKNRHWKKIRNLEAQLVASGSTGGMFAKSGSLSRQLHPSVPGFHKKTKQELRRKPTSGTVEEWARSLAEGQELDNTVKFQKEKKKKKMAKTEAKGVIASLVAAVEALEAEEEEEASHQLPYSKAALTRLIDKHATALQSALSDINILKKAVLGNFNAMEGNVNGDQVLTLGEMRVAAEYKLANNNLRAQVSRLEQMLTVERNARLAVEAKSNSVAP